MGRDLGLLGNHGGVHVDHAPFPEGNLPARFLQKHLAGRVFPARIGVGEKVADVRFAERAQNRVRDGVEQHISIGMPIESLGMRNFDPAQNQLPALRELMHIVSNPNMIHGPSISRRRR
jgi:hypothetical protein